VILALGTIAIARLSSSAIETGILAIRRRTLPSVCSSIEIQRFFPVQRLRDSFISAPTSANANGE